MKQHNALICIHYVSGMSQTYTEEIASFISDTNYDDIPTRAIMEVKRIILDCVGCALAGIGTDVAKIVINLASSFAAGGNSSLLGSSVKTNMLLAAFVNTTLINSMDYEPVGPEGHCSAVAIPVSFATGETSSSGKEILTSIALGLEVGGRVGASIRQSSTGQKKYSPLVHGHTFTAISAVVTAAKIFHLSEEQILDSLGLAGYSAPVPSMRKAFSTLPVPMTHFDFIGISAYNGILSALLGRDGLIGDRSVFDGDLGFWRFSGSDGCAWEHLTGELGKKWYVENMHYKHYPVILYNQPIIDCATKIVRNNNVLPKDIDSIKIQMRNPPKEWSSKDVRNQADAWRSVPFFISAAVHDLPPNRWQYPEAICDSSVKELMNKVVLESFPGVTERRISAVDSPASVEINANGRVYVEEKALLEPMTEKELIAKFQQNVQQILSNEQIARVIEIIFDLENIDNVGELMSIVTAPR